MISDKDLSAIARGAQTIAAQHVADSADALLYFIEKLASADQDRNGDRAYLTALLGRFLIDIDVANDAARIDFPKAVAAVNARLAHGRLLDMPTTLTSLRAGHETAHVYCGVCSAFIAREILTTGDLSALPSEAMPQREWLDEVLARKEFPWRVMHTAYEADAVLYCSACEIALQVVLSPQALTHALEWLERLAPGAAVSWVEVRAILGTIENRGDYADAARNPDLNELARRAAKAVARHL